MLTVRPGSADPKNVFHTGLPPTRYTVWPPAHRPICSLLCGVWPYNIQPCHSSGWRDRRDEHAYVHVMCMSISYEYDAFRLKTPKRGP